MTISNWYVSDSYISAKNSSKGMMKIRKIQIRAVCTERGKSERVHTHTQCKNEKKNTKLFPLERGKKIKTFIISRSRYGGGGRWSGWLDWNGFVVFAMKIEHWINIGPKCLMNFTRFGLRRRRRRAIWVCLQNLWLCVHGLPNQSQRFARAQIHVSICVNITNWPKRCKKPMSNYVLCTCFLWPRDTHNSKLYFFFRLSVWPILLFLLFFLVWRTIATAQPTVELI